MLDYRRLISYMYEYEGKEKGKNVGFVKLEARNGQCRLNVNVKRMYVGGNAIGVYLLGKSGEKTFLGNAFVRNGSGEFQTMVDAADVNGSGKPLDAYYGLTVHDVKSPWRNYTTMWEDAAAPEMPECVAAEVTEAQISETQISETQDDVAAISENTTEMLAEVPEKLVGTIDVVIKARSQITGEQDVDEQHGAVIEISEVENETETIENSEQKDIIGAEIKVHADREKIGETQTDIITGPIAQDVLPGSADIAPQNDNVSSVVKEIEEEVNGQFVQNTEAQPTSPELENPEVIRYLQESDDASPNLETLWQQMRKVYPKIQPFDYDGISEVLTIRPQDIGQLPRENWVYGNNSFLLHGYYNFRYLILIRLQNEGGQPRYLIGVPGHYYNSEKYMANMFGFPNFVLSKKQPPNDGRFGYWYTDVRQ